MAKACKTVFAQFTKVRSIHRGFYKWKMKDDNKKGYSSIGNWYEIFSSGICKSLYDVKPNVQSEPYAPYHGQLAIKCLVATYCMRWRCNSHRMGDRHIFLKILSASRLFRPDPSRWTVPLYPLWSQMQFSSTGSTPFFPTPSPPPLLPPFWYFDKPSLPKLQAIYTEVLPAVFYLIIHLTV